MTENSLLVIDDDATLNRLLSAQLRANGYRVMSALRWAEVEPALRQFEPAVILLDMHLPDANGLEKLALLTEFCPVIALTAYGSIDQAVIAIKHGAFDYLSKPVNPEVLDLALKRCLAAQSLKRNYEFFKRQAHTSATKALVGQSSAMSNLRKTIELVAPSDATVLILGETGVGKERVAAAVHQASMRASQHFVAINCSTFQENLFESELFGHERGSFTGADRRKEGLVEVGNGGTLFLDEIGEMPIGLQAKLLRLLDTGHFRRVGGNKDLHAEVRFVAATNRDLQAMCADGTFRSDLYYRLSTFIMRVPPLRERADDIPILAEYFLQSREFTRGADKRLTAAALDILMSYDWPGNIRELRNVVERGALLSGVEPEIRVPHIGALRRMAPTRGDWQFSFDHSPTVDEMAEACLRRLLTRPDLSRAEMASMMGISERKIYRLLNSLQIDDHRR